MIAVEGAKVLFQRSKDLHNMCYTAVLSSRDCKPHTKVCRIKPCGQDVTTEKGQCIYYMVKRLGTALRSYMFLQGATVCKAQGTEVRVPDKLSDDQPSRTRRICCSSDCEGPVQQAFISRLLINLLTDKGLVWHCHEPCEVSNPHSDFALYQQYQTCWGRRGRL